MTDTMTCQTMNAIYEMLKPLTVDQIQEVRRDAHARITGRNLSIAVHCCNETIRRKMKGIWA